MRFAVLGAGALGSVLAGTLAAAHPVTLVGHESPHLSAIRDSGLTVERPDGSRESHQIDATQDHGSVSDADILVVAVKAYDTATAMEDVEPYLRDVDVLTLQNGLGNAETIRSVVPAERVIAGTTTNGAYVGDPGVVHHTGWGETTIGRLWADNDEIVEALAAAFRSVGFETSVTADVARAIWRKVLVNVGINPITALAGVQNGALVEEGPGQRLLEAAVSEAETVANEEGYEFDRDPVTVTKDVARDTADNWSSMRQDVERGSRTEIGALNGAIAERAAAHDLPVPVNKTLVDLVRLLEQGRAGG